MKIKCPSCSAVLAVPDTAAGKIVKCPCGKQLRAPGGAAQQPAAQNPPAAPQQRPPTQQPSAKRATPQRPEIRRQPAAPQQAGGDAGFSGFEGGLFDELTDGDLQPVTAVAQPGVKKEQKSTGGKLLQQYSGGDVEGGKQTQPGDRPGTLTFLGVINGFWTFLSIAVIAFALGLAGVLGVDPELLMAIAEEKAFWIIIMAVAVGLTLQLATTISCFVSHWICWQIVLFSYGFNVSDRIMGIVGMIQDEEGAKAIVKSCVYLLAAIFFFCYLHTEEVRQFYRVGDLSVKKVIVADLLGLLCGLGLGIFLVFG